MTTPCTMINGLPGAAMSDQCAMCSILPLSDILVIRGMSTVSNKGIIIQIRI